MDCPVCGRPTVTPHNHLRRGSPVQTVAVIHADTVRALLGLKKAEEVRAQCGKSCWMPTASGGWSLVVCPVRTPHTTHTDENLVPCFTDEDVEFFNEQHRLGTA